MKAASSSGEKRVPRIEAQTHAPQHGIEEENRDVAEADKQM